MREFIGSRSSSLNHDIRDIFDLAKDRFIDLQEAVDYIEMTDSGTNVIQEPYSTLGYLITKEPTYVFHSLIEIHKLFHKSL